MNRTTIVVRPASLFTNWEREIARFAPGVPVRRHHGAARDLNGLPAGGIVLTSYGTLLRDVDEFRGIFFNLVVTDEAQKNSGCSLIGAPSDTPFACWLACWSSRASWRGRSR